jgi:hypothetical protein
MQNLGVWVFLGIIAMGFIISGVMLMRDHIRNKRRAKLKKAARSNAARMRLYAEIDGIVELADRRTRYKR